MSQPNAVWIEFETNPPKPEAIKRMNKMLERLGIGMYFIMDRDGNLYSTSKAASGPCKLLADNGDWFNLDYAGRDD